MKLCSYEFHWRPFYFLQQITPQVVWSPRRLLFYNNCFLFIFSISLSAFSTYLCVIFSNGSHGSPVRQQTAIPSTEEDGTWLVWLFLVFQGFFLSLISIIGMRGGHLIDMSLLLAYFWLCVVFVAPVVLTTVACFDFFQYITIWFRHNWDISSFSKIRHLFCESGTADNLCAVPIQGGIYGNMTAWCLGLYNSTACEGIRNNAIQSAVNLGSSFSLAQGLTGVVTLFEIGISMYLCIIILTHSVITESMNDIINFLLILPIAGCVGVGAYVYKLRSLAYFSWFPIFFIGLAALQVVALPLGIIAGRLKSQPMLRVYIVIATIVTAGLGAAGATAFIFAGVIQTDLKPTEAQKNDLACTQGFTSCCCCDHLDYFGNYTTNTCPEWSTSDIVSLLQLDLKVTGVVAIVSMAYLVGSLTVAGLLNTDLKNYKTDYV